MSRVTKSSNTCNIYTRAFSRRKVRAFPRATRDSSSHTYNTRVYARARFFEKRTIICHALGRIFDITCYWFVFPPENDPSPPPPPSPLRFFGGGRLRGGGGGGGARGGRREGLPAVRLVDFTGVRRSHLKFSLSQFSQLFQAAIFFVCF